MFKARQRSVHYLLKAEDQVAAKSKKIVNNCEKTRKNKAGNIPGTVDRQLPIDPVANASGRVAYFTGPDFRLSRRRKYQ